MVSLLSPQDRLRLFYLEESLGMTHRRTRPDKLSRLPRRRRRHNFVYDLETEDGTFMAGTCNLIVKNTDSVFVKFATEGLTKEEAIQKSFRLGEESATMISDTFKKPIELEFEKVYYPLLLFSKKRYSGLMYENPEVPTKIDSKGIQVVRRDNCPFVRAVSLGVLNIIMHERDVEKAAEYVRGEAAKLLNGTVDPQQLILSKSMRKEYKSTNLPHLAVARKIEARTPGSGPRSGDRIPYLFVKTGGKVKEQYLKAEDPEYVVEHKLPLDHLYYLDRQLTNPIVCLFELLYDNAQQRLFGDLRRDAVNKMVGQQNITSFFKKK